MVVQYIIKTVVFLLAAVLSTACVREDLSACDVSLALTFHYTHNTQNQDLFSKEVDNVTLFIHDSQGKLIKMEEAEVKNLTDGNRYQLTLPVGDYKIVVYGNIRDSYSYQSIEYYPEAFISVNRDAMVQVAPNIESLFYGAIDKIAVTNSKESEHKIFFKKNSNLVRVILRGTNPTEQLSDVECKISAINGDYKFDNTIYGNDRVHYIPSPSGKSTDLAYDFNVLQLWQDDESQLSVVQQNAGSPKIWYTGSLTALLLKKPGTDLDLEDTFEVIFTLDSSNNSVKITVNDWEVIDHNSGL